MLCPRMLPERVRCGECNLPSLSRSLLSGAISLSPAAVRTLSVPVRPFLFSVPRNPVRILCPHLAPPALVCPYLHALSLSAVPSNIPSYLVCPHLVGIRRFTDENRRFSLPVPIYFPVRPVLFSVPRNPMRILCPHLASPALVCPHLVGIRHFAGENRRFPCSVPIYSLSPQSLLATWSVPLDCLSPPVAGLSL
jgi:hypothetical protein